MSYASVDSAALLASRKWRLRHSAWLLAPIFGMGILSFAGFVYIGLRVRTRKFWTALVIGCVGSVLVVIATELVPGAGGGGIIVAIWFGLVGYGFVINRDYLRWRATHSGRNAWYAQPAAGNVTASAALAPAPGTPVRSPVPATSAPPVAPPPQAPPFLDVDSSQFYAAPGVAQPSVAPAAPPAAQVEPPGWTAVDTGPVDANSAPAAELAAVLRIDATLADRIVSARQISGGFRDLDDLVATARLQPHELVKIRGKVSFGPVQAPPRPPLQQTRQVPQPPAPPPFPAEQRTGRILDY